MHYLYLVFAIITEVIGTLALKATHGFTVLIPSLTVIIGYGLSFYFMSLSLEKISIAIVYSIWSGVGIVLIAFAGYVFYKQHLDAAAIGGMTFIVIGVVIISAFSNMKVH